MVAAVAAGQSPPSGRVAPQGGSGRGIGFGIGSSPFLLGVRVKAPVGCSLHLPGPLLWVVLFLLWGVGVGKGRWGGGIVEWGGGFGGISAGGVRKAAGAVE
jgi:hypothetical protein